MIRINLATRKQAAQATEQKGGKSLFGGGPKLSFDSLKDLPVRKMALMVLVAILGYYFLEDYKEAEIKKLDTEIARLNAEQTKLRAGLAKIKEFEALQKQLDADEFIMRNKIETIEKLIQDRQTPPKLLLAMANTIPQDVWLTGLNISGGKVTLNGMSLGFNQISDFMKNLNENIYFTDLRLVNTQQGKDNMGTEIATFELQAKRR